MLCYESIARFKFLVKVIIWKAFGHYSCIPSNPYWWHQNIWRIHCQTFKIFTVFCSWSDVQQYFANLPETPRKIIIFNFIRKLLYNLFGYFPWHDVWQDEMWKMLIFLTFLPTFSNKLVNVFEKIQNSIALVSNLKIFKIQTFFITIPIFIYFLSSNFFEVLLRKIYKEKLVRINFRNPSEISFGNNTSGHFLIINVSSL